MRLINVDIDNCIATLNNGSKVHFVLHTANGNYMGVTAQDNSIIDALDEALERMNLIFEVTGKQPNISDLHMVSISDYSCVVKFKDFYYNDLLAYFNIEQSDDGLEAINLTDVVLIEDMTEIDFNLTSEIESEFFDFIRNHIIDMVA